MGKEVKILWTTDNKESSLHMVCLYAHNAKLKGWMDSVTILVWGASQKLISEDEEIQQKIKEMVKDGVKVVACLKCADNLKLSSSLQSCDIELFYTGELLSEWINSDKKIICV